MSVAGMAAASTWDSINMENCSWPCNLTDPCASMMFQFEFVPLNLRKQVTCDPCLVLLCTLANTNLQFSHAYYALAINKGFRLICGHKANRQQALKQMSHAFDLPTSWPSDHSSLKFGKMSRQVADATPCLHVCIGDKAIPERMGRPVWTDAQHAWSKDCCDCYRHEEVRPEAQQQADSAQYVPLGYTPLPSEWWQVRHLSLNALLPERTDCL